MEDAQEIVEPEEMLNEIPELLTRYDNFPDEWIDGKGNFVFLGHMGLGNLGPTLRIEIDREQFQYIKRVKAVMDEREKQALASRNDDYAGLQSIIELFKDDREILDRILPVLAPRLAKARREAGIPDPPSYREFIQGKRCRKSENEKKETK